MKKITLTLATILSCISLGFIVAKLILNHNLLGKSILPFIIVISITATLAVIYWIDYFDKDKNKYL